MSHSHVMGHEMPVICQIVFFNHACIAEVRGTWLELQVPELRNWSRSLLHTSAHSVPISIFAYWRVGSFPSEQGDGGSKACVTLPEPLPFFIHFLSSSYWAVWDN